ncbi:MAG: hypothetical protein JST30_06515 [Armatimonadetes bacterium]|nr:hypothetical protein [Armatimonadota bacterium]
MSFGLSTASPEALADLWKTTYGAALTVEPEDIVSKQTGHPLLVASAVLLDGQGEVRSFAVLKGPATPRVFPGQDPDRFHLSALAFRTVEDGREALTAVLADPVLATARSVVFGMDADHLLPGAPVTAAYVQDLLEEFGFVAGGEAFDLERDLGGYLSPSRCHEAVIKSDARIFRCADADVPSLDGFLERTFPGRWRYDTLRKAVDDGEPEDIVLLTVGGEVEGFAFTQTPASKRPVGGAVWRRSLGPCWAALGPIGIARSARGRGLGDALLGGALELLARSGARRTVIDWTTLDAFYGSHGFQITRRYRSMAKPLG